ncbi:MAG: malonyl-CoA decarboxylase family protein [Azospirillum sp.]|nr:malonyl-CoA decarboxylase family protein [Azospirillum sp.]MCA3266071.1 malonyl-CoA decarboxylase family protein [Azospirillum sp.]MCZ8123053.1 malonyl-CoA decarboxylase family protein [Magnetospirillum sp.]
MTDTRAGSKFVARLKEAWRDLSTSARAAVGAAKPPHPDLPDADLPALRARMRDCLEGKGGEASARQRAVELGSLYLGLSTVGRKRFLGALARDFDIDRAAAARAAEAALGAWKSDDAKKRVAAEAALKSALDAPRAKLLQQFTALPEGVKFLVDRRAELLEWSREDAALAALEADLKDLLVAWFDLGFLELRRITWESPAALLEKLAAYEAVHAVRDWADLKNRLDSDRRYFAFFHPRMKLEPLIFVEVALVSGLAGDVQSLLDDKAPVGDPGAADTAIFYSISNAQKGLAGISFGGFLIKRVVATLQSEFPNLKTFATLSPVPGFRAWLDRRFAEGARGLLTREERATLAAAIKGEAGWLAGKGDLKRCLADDAWAANPALAAALEAPLTRLCASYLMGAKRADGRAADPVAHFHLSNGARLERINWRADMSGKGLRQSAGMMVNYLYRLADIEANHEAYAADGAVTAASAVRALAK